MSTTVKAEGASIAYDTSLGSPKGSHIVPAAIADSPAQGAEKSQGHQGID
jgi:hypothetical protein